MCEQMNAQNDNEWIIATASITRTLFDSVIMQ